MYDEKPIEDVLKYVSGLGYEAVELAMWQGSHHLNIDEILAGGATELKRTVEKHGLIISALSNLLKG